VSERASATVDLGDVAYHYVEAGAGPVLVLLHGWPQTWYAWRHVIDALAPRFRVIAPDLRGLGDSSRPAGGYDKATIANDVVRLLDRLHVTNFNVAGHDWGGVVAYALARDRPQRVCKFAVLDVTIPGDGVDGFSQGGKRWHHAFHRVLDLPEALTAQREEHYLRWFYDAWPVARETFDDATVAEYIRTYSLPNAMHCGFEYYRALPGDIEYNAQRLSAGEKLAMPALGLGGDGPWARGREVGDSLRRVAMNVRDEVVPNCGHFIPEEQPEYVARVFRDFFADSQR